MAYNEGHQQVARLLLAKCIIEEKELQTEVDEIEDVLGVGLNENPPREIVEKIKEKLVQIGLTIEEIRYPMTDKLFFGLRVVVANDEVSRFSTDLDEKLIKLYEKIVNAACEHRGFVTWKRILEENKKLNEMHRNRAKNRKQITHVSREEAMEFMEELVLKKWLEPYRHVKFDDGELTIDSRGIFAIGPRTMCDLRQYLDERTENLGVEGCALCQEICWLRGMPCPNHPCSLIMHQQCITTWGRPSCPTCQTDWVDGIPGAVDLYGPRYRAEIDGDGEVSEEDEDRDEDVNMSQQKGISSQRSRHDLGSDESDVEMEG